MLIYLEHHLRDKRRLLCPLLGQQLVNLNVSLPELITDVRLLGHVARQQRATHAVETSFTPIVFPYSFPLSTLPTLNPRASAENCCQAVIFLYAPRLHCQLITAT